MTSENKTAKVEILSNEFLKEIFDKQEEIVQSAVIEQAEEVLKRKVFEWFKQDIFELVENKSCRYLLNTERKNIYEMEEEEVRVLFATCLTHSIASFGLRHMYNGEPLVLI